MEAKTLRAWMAGGTPSNANLLHIADVLEVDNGWLWDAYVLKDAELSTKCRQRLVEYYAEGLGLGPARNEPQTGEVPRAGDASQGTGSANS